MSSTDNSIALKQGIIQEEIINKNYDKDKYTLKKVTLDGNDIDFTDSSNTYIMPDHNVEIKLTFKSNAAHEITYDSNFKEAITGFYVTSDVPNYHQISDYSNLENDAEEIAHIDLIDEELVNKMKAGK